MSCTHELHASWQRHTLPQEPVADAHQARMHGQADPAAAQLPRISPKGKPPILPRGFGLPDLPDTSRGPPCTTTTSRRP